MKPVECFSHSRKKVFVDICTVRSLRGDVQWLNMKDFVPEKQIQFQSQIISKRKSH